MIEAALAFLKDELDAYIVRWLGLGPKEGVELSPIVDKDGLSTIGTRLGIGLINVEEERINKQQTRNVTTIDGRTHYTAPVIRLNLHIIVAARVANLADSYLEALKSLSAAATFFQSHRSFESVAYPSLDPKIDTLIVELEPVDYEAQNNIWGALGGKMLPSLHYRVRLVTIAEDLVEETGSPIKEIVLEERL